jgi:hypothetical protein
MADKDSPPYPVGYAKPPQATRFKPGQSGNPKGRRRGAKNFATLFDEKLEAKVPITENGRRKKITKRRAAVKQIVNKAAGGDVKAISTVLNETRLHEAQSGNDVGHQVLSSAQDEQVVADIVDRIRRKLAQAPSECTNPTESPSKPEDNGSKP